jgi:hypothetical protein
VLDSKRDGEVAVAMFEDRVLGVQRRLAERERMET